MLMYINSMSIIRIYIFASLEKLQRSVVYLPERLASLGIMESHLGTPSTPRTSQHYGIEKELRKTLILPGDALLYRRQPI